MLFYWHSGLVVWNGLSQKWEYVSGQNSNSGEYWNHTLEPITPFNYSFGGGGGATPSSGTQQYTVGVGFDAYTYAWVQTWYWIHGHWAGGHWNWLNPLNVWLVEVTADGACHFP
jgi:hypothetical protein